MQDQLETNDLPTEKSVEIIINCVENIVITDSISLHFIIEHNNTVLGESSSFTTDANEDTTTRVYDINFVVKYLISLVDQTQIDLLASTPIIIKAIMSHEKGAESSTSELSARKKSKFTVTSQPISAVFGICNIDLIPMLLGEQKFMEKVKLEEVQFPFGNSPEDHPMLTVTVMQDHISFFPVNENVNYMMITVESLYNIPDSFTDKFDYKTGTIVYNDSQTPECIYFHGGIRTTSENLNDKKAWSSLSNLENSAKWSDYKLNTDLSDIKNANHFDFNFMELRESNLPRIEWNSLSRRILRKEGIEATKDHIAQFKYWPFQFLIMERGTDTNKTKSKDKQAKVQLYQSYIDVSELLFPGRRRTHVLGEVHVYNPTDITNKVGLENNIFRVDTPVKELKDRDKRSKTSKSVAQSTYSENEMAHGGPLIGSNGNKTVILIEIEFYHPLIPSRIIPDFSNLIDDLMLTQKKKTPYVYSPDTAEEQYAICVQRLSELLAESYRDFHEEFLSTVQSQGDADRKFCYDPEPDELVCFTQYLYKTGLYSSIQNTLRAKVTMILDQKFKIQSNLVESIETQNFIASIYTYLTDTMHTAINKIVEGRSANDEEDTESFEKLYFYAEEAYELGQFDEAKRFYTSAITQNKGIPEAWIRYAIFHLKTGDIDRAEECAMEAITLKSRHKIALILYGGIMFAKCQYQEAEIFFRAVTELYPRFIEGWTILHLFYLQIEYCPGIDVTLRTAEKCMKDKIRDTEILYCEPLAWSMIHCSQDRIYLIVITFLLKLGLHGLVSTALTQEMKLNKSVNLLYYMAVERYLMKDNCEALIYLDEAQEIYGMDYSIGSLKGHCYYQEGDFKNAIECYEYVHSLFNRPDDLHLVEIRMGSYYLETENYSSAKKVFLSACKSSPSAETWLGVGKSLFYLKDFQKAEAALTESNRIDNCNPEVWGYLCLLNLTLDKHDEFLQCYRETVKNNLRNKKLWLTITESMEALGIAPPIIVVESEDESLVEINE